MIAAASSWAKPSKAWPAARINDSSSAAARRRRRYAGQAPRPAQRTAPGRPGQIRIHCGDGALTTHSWITRITTYSSSATPTSDPSNSSAQRLATAGRSLTSGTRTPLVGHRNQDAQRKQKQRPVVPPAPQRIAERDVGERLGEAEETHACCSVLGQRLTESMMARRFSIPATAV